MKYTSRRATVLSATALVTALTMCLGGTIAYAVDTQDHNLSSVLESVSDDQGAPVNNGSLEDMTETEFVADDGSETQISIGNSGVVEFSAGGNPGFALDFEDVSSQLEPENAGEPLAYEAGKEAILVPQIIDTHFRGVFVLESASSPSEFTMSVSSDEGIAISSDAEGGIIFQDAAGEAIGGIAAPWAKDAHDRPVPTHFVVEGQQVRQVVNVSELNPEDFPVVADPAVYVNFTKKYVIDVKNHGNVAKWKYLNQCTAAKKKKCDVGRSYTVSASVQTALNISTSFVGGQIGITAGASSTVNVSCSITGPGKVTLYASANKKTYKVRTVRTYGYPTKLKKETKTSGTLTAYKPNGKYVCS